VSGGPRRIIVPNFIEIGCSIAAILQFCKFSRWRPPPSWIFEIVNFYLLTVSGGPRRITVPNFVKIGRSVTEILRFFEFLRFLKSWNFIHYWGPELQDASACQILSKSVNRFEDIKIFWFFKMAAVRHLGFVWGMFGLPTVSIGISITLQNWVMIDAVVSIIWTLQYLARLAGKCLFMHPNWGFWAIWSPKWAPIST